MKNFRDLYSVLSTAEKKGREEGRKEGKAEGRIEEKRENAHKLKKLGIATDIISQATGLSNEDIDNLI